MKWQEIVIVTTNQAEPAINNMLMESGASGIQIDDDQNPIQIHGFFPEEVDVEQLSERLKMQVDALKQYGLDPSPAKVFPHQITDNSWQTAWEKYYHPSRITHYLTIVPKWENYQPESKDEHIIKLDPGMAFGTGTHPTTVLTIHALETMIHGGETMYDVGTGSGVLSIAAKWMGAGHIVAFDVDQVAVDSALMNLKMNPISNDVEVRANNLLDHVNDQVDLVVANMLPDVLVPMIPQAANCLNDEGTLILGGIIKEKLPLIESTLAQNGFFITETFAMKDWRSLIATKKEGLLVATIFC